MKLIRILKNKGLRAFEFMTGSRKRLVAASSASIMTVILVMILMGRSYSLNPAVTHSIYTIPNKTVFYAEILDPQEFYHIFESSAFGKGLIDSQAWQKLSGTPEFMKLSNLLYFIELKAKLLSGTRIFRPFSGDQSALQKWKTARFCLSGKRTSNHVLEFRWFRHSKETR